MRRESRTGAGHRDFSVEGDPGMSPSEAATRRDFTVNAMLWDPRTGEVLDPWGGMADLAARRLRHVSEKFAEDPLRVLRAKAERQPIDEGQERLRIEVVIRENLPPESYGASF